MLKANRACCRKRPTWMASPKQKHPCWGAISFSFIKKRSKHPEVCPSGKGNSPCRRLASGRTLCGEFANRSCCRKRPTWVASPKQKHPCWGAFVLEAPPGIGPGIKVLQTSALPLGYGAVFLKKRVRIGLFVPAFWSGLRGSNPPPPPWQGGALPNELNPHKLSRLSLWCLRSELNQRHGDFQSPALPTELQRHTARAVPYKKWRSGWGSNPRPLA